VQAQVERLERERQACAAGARVGEQQWEGRIILPPIPDHARGDRWPTPTRTTRKFGRFLYGRPRGRPDPFRRAPD
jgi:hypothetical protein